MVWGLVLDLTDFTCPDEFASILVQESLILTLVAEGNWIRILKKKSTEKSHSFWLLWWSQTSRLLLHGSLNGLNGPFYSLLPWGVLAESVVFKVFAGILRFSKRSQKPLVVCESHGEDLPFLHKRWPPWTFQEDSYCILNSNRSQY